MNQNSFFIFFAFCLISLNADAQNIVLPNEVANNVIEEPITPEITNKNQITNNEIYTDDAIPDFKEEEIPKEANITIDDSSYAANEKALTETRHRQRAIDPQHQIKLVSLAKLLGSMHAIRALCSGTNDQTYRTKMTAMINLESPDDSQSKAPMIIAFNEGFQRITTDSSRCDNQYKMQEKSLAMVGYKIASELAAEYRSK